MHAGSEESKRIVLVLGVGAEITVVVFVTVVVTATDGGIGLLTFGTSFNILNNLILNNNGINYM